ncbi:Crp/Fnr family transcriptional regulator [Novimethylophilus kurashikiensis]|uniref:Crp/Fnr family transcriptional regulator n=1 Tax=Novimethylophilus kurashikiensis TaxID=1825523 RepID=A0A2R5FER0_9PROT|nr:Crp/Fnr family transcriptional regulator [Novimethylophilus kurashikiensis]GBG15838.1 Crp/Fnr family transcriptional regulator [Novimethylophilus kurashikiensis]
MQNLARAYQPQSTTQPWRPRPAFIHSPKQNYLLSCLPEALQDRIYPELELVELRHGQVLQEPGDKWRYAYFPTTSILSKIYLLESGSTAEIAVVGNEGMVSICLFMGGESMPNQTVVKSAGHAYRLKGKLLKDEFYGSSDMQSLFLRYTQALLTQMAQTAVCNRHHSVEQQLCRWLLLNLDRLSSNEMIMTQEFIANMLGVRREGITEAAGHLQSAGLIQYCRGRIRVIDRLGLEARACECYDVVKREFDRLLPAAI